MPVVFDDVHAEVAQPPQSDASRSDGSQPAQGASADNDPAEVMREKMRLWTERELRLEID